MSQDKEKAPELGGEGSVSKEASPAKATGTASTNSAENASEKLPLKRNVAEQILGEIHWKENGDSGYCTCPGRDLHSNANAKTDCQVWLGIDGRAPTIHCVHDSCCGPIADANHKFRSELGKIDASGRTATRAEIRESQERQRLYRLEKRKKELVGKAWASQLQSIQEQFPWALNEVVKDSPADVLQFLRPGSNPQWIELIDLIFQDDDVVYVGHRGTPRGREFKTKREWLSIYNRPDAPPLGIDEIYTSPFAWNPGSKTKERSNQLHRRALVLESDTLGENVFPVFKWLSQLLELRAIVFSGNKSFHAWFSAPPPDLESELKELAPALQLDRAMFTNALARLPGVTRPDTGKPQELIYLATKEVAA